MRTLSLLLLGFLFSAQLLAADGSTGSGRFDFRKKAVNKEGSRWTLEDWLKQKERSQLMDLWLAMYAPSPYEFFIEGAYVPYTRKADPTSTMEEKSFASSRGALGAYATVLGLQGEYENNIEEDYSDLTGMLCLRIAGNAVQGTHLIVQGGMKTRQFEDASTPKLAQTFGALDLDLYATRYFGLHGNYRKYSSVEHETFGDVSGSLWEGGLFIDFSALRVFGYYRQDKEVRTLNGQTTTIDRSGVMSGIKFFF